jgi:hypothetical protein
MKKLTLIPTTGQNLKGKLVVLSAEHYLGDEPARLFRCEDGFGCTPGLHGQAVFGVFMADGEKCRVERYEIEGVVAEEPARDAEG